MVENNEEIEITNDPYHIAGGAQILLRRHNKLGKKMVYCWSTALNEHHSIKIMDLVAKSTKSDPVVEPMDVFIIPKERALPGIVFITNHIDGSIEPTDWDKAVAKRLLLASKIMNIALLDYVIINEKDYYSLKETGLLQEIGKIADDLLAL
jgi:DNA repair protein RadC